MLDAVEPNVRQCSLSSVLKWSRLVIFSFARFNHNYYLDWRLTTERRPKRKFVNTHPHCILLVRQAMLINPCCEEWYISYFSETWKKNSSIRKHLEKSDEVSIGHVKPGRHYQCFYSGDLSLCRVTAANLPCWGCSNLTIFWTCRKYLLVLAGLILDLHPANKRRRYFVTTCLIGWVQA